ncbi:hypothetical protein ABTW96_20580 [Nocardia beijingensis]|uniref:hypothetical protein n=1 Tax=Nocardia beijingensis TaxID=95162 RepID=UPI00333210B2
MSQLAKLFTATIAHELKYFSEKTSEILCNHTRSCSDFARNSASATSHLDQELGAGIRNRESWFTWPDHPPHRDSSEWHAFLDRWNRYWDENPSIADDFVELDRYLCSEDYREIQAALRNKHNAPLSPDHQETVDGAVRALQRVPKFQGSVVRHVNSLPPEVLERYQKGNTVTEEAFTSTTRNPNGVPIHKVRADVEMRIESKTGSDMRYIPLVIKGDDEVLFPPGTRFHVTDRYFDEKSGLTVIKMVEKV